MAGSEYYDHTTYPSQGASGSSSAMRSELDLVETGFGKLPDLVGNGGKITAINSGGTAIEAITTTGTGSGVRATSPTLVTPNLGTPSALVGTNITGTATGLTAGNVTTNANLTGPITSTGNATAVTTQTGTGSTFVMQASPTLTTPNIGTPSAGVATNLTGLPLTTGVTGTLPVANGGTGITTTTAYSPVFSGTTATGNFQASLGPGTSGQVLTSAGAGAVPVWANASIITSGTVQATTSGTFKDFTGIPAGVKRITVMPSGVSTNGTSRQIIQLMVGGVAVTTGYLSYGSTNGATSTITNGFFLNGRGDAANATEGLITLCLQDSATNKWNAQGATQGANNDVWTTVGGKSLSGALTGIRITTENGTDAFDAGLVNILYE